MSKHVLIKNPAVTIANAATQSSVHDLEGDTLVGFYTPAALTGTTITFEATRDGSNFFPVRNASGQISYTVTTSQYYAVNPSDFAGVRQVRLVSGSAEGAARTITLACRTIY